MIPAKRASSPIASTSTTTLAPMFQPPTKTRRLVNGDASLVTERKLGGTMNRVWVNFIENVWDGDHFEEALGVQEGMIDQYHLPTPAQVRQLLSVALSPEDCLKHPRESLEPPTSDPFPVTARKIRLETLHILEDIASTSGGAAVCRAIPGYGKDPSLHPVVPPTYDKHGEEIIVDEAELDPHPEEDDRALTLAGKRVAACADVWSFLGGASAKTPPAGSATPMTRGAWDVLRTLVTIWEGEVAAKRESAVSPSLLQSLQPNSAGLRELSRKELDVVFLPFLNAGYVAEEEENSYDPLDDDSMEVGERKRVSMRLVALFAQATLTGRLVVGSTIREIVNRLMGLSAASIQSFFSLLSPALPLFNIRLSMAYLETASHALQASSSSTSVPVYLPPIQSPSRPRPLGASGSSSALLASPLRTGSSSQPAYFTLPSVKDVLAVASKLPLAFPLPLSASETSLQQPARRAPSRKPTFAMVQQAFESHLIVKEMLVDAVLQQATVELETRVVGAADIPLSRKAQAALKKAQAAAPLNTTRGRDPTITVVEKPAEKDTFNDGRPDKAAYDTEQNALRAQIDALQAKSNDVRNRIAAVSGKGPNHERKVALRAELDSLRGEQARIKGGRGKTLDQVKLLQDGVGKKIKDLQAAKAKLPFKTVAEVDNQIKNLERQVESGSMKLVEEKKALNEISTLKKTRKNVESFGAQQTAIDSEKAKIDEIRAGLDDPEAKSISDKFNAARSELDTINKAHDEASKGRDALFEERNAISKQLDALFTQKKESASAYREANNKFYQKQNDDRAKRLERQRAERAAYEDSKKAEINNRLLEEAQAPAFEREIEDCRTLIDQFQRRIGLASTASASTAASIFDRTSVAGVPQLEIRKVEAAPEGFVALKKKGEQEEEVWGGSKKSKKGGKKAPAAAGTPAAEGDAQALNLPFGTLSALLTLGITSPLTTAEVPKTIEALETKKKYFVENQDRVTKERVAVVEKKIAQAEAKSKANGTSTPDAEAEAAPAAVEEPAKEEETSAPVAEATEDA